MAAVKFIDSNFADPSGAGYLTAKPARDQAFPPGPERDENAVLARTANMLFRYTADQFYSQVASRAMRRREPTNRESFPRLPRRCSPIHASPLNRFISRLWRLKTMPPD